MESLARGSSTELTEGDITGKQVRFEKNDGAPADSSLGMARLTNGLSKPVVVTQIITGATPGKMTVPAGGKAVLNAAYIRNSALSIEVATT